MTIHSHAEVLANNEVEEIDEVQAELLAAEDMDALMMTFAVVGAALQSCVSGYNARHGKRISRRLAPVPDLADDDHA